MRMRTNMSFLFNISSTSTTTLVCVSFLILVLIVKWVFSFSTRPSYKNLPPSPPKLPIIGNIHQLGSLPHRSLRPLAKSHGPLVLIHLGSVPVLVASSADAAREVMKTHDLVFANRPKSKNIQALLYNYKDVSMAPYGEYWRQVKSICVLHLLSNKRVVSFRGVREEETRIMVDRIKEECSKSCGSPVNLSNLLTHITNNIICRVAMGRRYDGGECGIKFKDLLNEMIELLGVVNLGDYISWLSWVTRLSGFDARVKRVAKEFDKFIDRVVEEHENGEKRGSDQMDFVDILLWIQRENIISFPIDRESIKAVVLFISLKVMYFLVDVFAAGTHTTSTVPEWVMAELLRHPNVMQKLQSEVRGIANGRHDITEDDLEKLPFLKAVIKETLRLHPPLPLLIARESSRDLKLMGYDIAAGTQVMINAWLIARDPATWERAEEFWPERFLNCSTDFKGQHFEYIPFGAGRRGCPGIRFAMDVSELVLAKTVLEFDWALPDGVRAEDLDMSEAPGITVVRKVPLEAIPTPYVHSSSAATS